MRSFRILELIAALGVLAGCGDSCRGDDLLGPQVELASGLANPESVVVGFDGRIYISEIGERDKDGDGRVSVISGGKVVPFAVGLDDPKGITAVRDRLFVTDKTRVWSIDRDGKATVFAAKESFPVEPLFLNDIAAAPGGGLFVSDSGLREGGQGKVFRLSGGGGKAALVADQSRIPDLKRPNGLLVSRDGKLLIADAMSGALYRASLANNDYEKIAEGLGGPDGIVEDLAGNLFVSDVRGGKVFRIRPGDPEPVLVAEGYGSAADIAAAFDRKSLLVPDMKNGKIIRLPVAPAPSVAPIFRDLQNPESIVRGSDGTYYVSVIGEFQKQGDGSVTAFPPGKPPVVLAAGLDDPKGIEFRGGDLYVTDIKRVLKITRQGRVSVFAAAEAFPTKPLYLNDIAAGADGTFYVSDSGDLQGARGAVFAMGKDGKITTVIDSQSPLPVKGPDGILPDGQGKLWVADFYSGDLLLVNLADKKAEKIAGGLPGADGLALDYEGTLYISRRSTGQVSMLPVGAKEATLIANQFVAAADMCFDANNGRLMVPDTKAGTVTPWPLPDRNPKGVDESPLEVRIEPVFEEVSFNRPIVVAHAGDDTNRLFIATQHGQVFVMPNDPSVTEAKLLLDWRGKTAPYEKANEEGFLGLAFHPQFRANGRFFVYYTAVDMPRRSVISRFTADPKDPAAPADPNSEQIVMEIPQPYSNHNGGTIAFGPDGYLYVGLGDGGAGGDPHGNGQKLGTMMGKILRVDVDRQDSGKGYAVPNDNPFVGTAGAAPEIWALGIRNIWRLSFDRETGDLWAGEVGQNIWEEVNLITRGGNYGWKPRESMHKFNADGSLAKPEFIEPLWEYHHEFGRSITGGNVYRGKKVPELKGYYLYGDFVTGRIWGLKVDVETKKVTANRPIAGNVAPVMTFGEDQDGEVYFTTVNGGIFRFTSIPSTSQ